MNAKKQIGIFLIFLFLIEFVSAQNDTSSFKSKSKEVVSEFTYTIEQAQRDIEVLKSENESLKNRFSDLHVYGGLFIAALALFLGTNWIVSGYKAKKIVQNEMSEHKKLMKEQLEELDELSTSAHQNIEILVNLIKIAEKRMDK
ncbi:MAG: hypothetical protein J5I47_04625 [Vicingus serpentipes]|nr:hypothetical protein [Vicingus serpentipes]